jgi:hypothetical protein
MVPRGWSDEGNMNETQEMNFAALEMAVSHSDMPGGVDHDAG